MMRGCDTISSELGGRSEIRATRRHTTQRNQNRKPWPARRRIPQPDIRRTRARVQALTQHHARWSPQPRVISSADSHRLAF